jgi:hypothetical protein
MERARALSPGDVRSEYLELVSAQLKIRDRDVADAADRAVKFLLERISDHTDTRKPTPYL